MNFSFHSNIFNHILKFIQNHTYNLYYFSCFYIDVTILKHKRINLQLGRKQEANLKFKNGNKKKNHLPSRIKL